MGQRLYEGMSLREVTEFLFVEDQPESADLILVFGSHTPSRAQRAAELYHAGFAPRILVTGGNASTSTVSEADFLKQHLLDLGVPADAILTETRSVNTRENVLLSVPILGTDLGWDQVRSIIVVSAPHHMHRARQVLARHIPASTRILCCPDQGAGVTRGDWWTSEEGRHLVFRELEKVRRYALQGEM